GSPTRWCTGSPDRPSPLPGWLAALEFRRQPLVQALTVADRQLEGPVVGRQDQDVPRGIEDGRADLAVLAVPLDLRTKLGRHGVVDVVRDLRPHMLAVQLHGILPQNPLRAGAVVLSNGARRFCSITRARCSLTFTTFSLTPRAEAVSLTFSPSRSRRV